jgi:hypothetical protein
MKLQIFAGCALAGLLLYGCAATAADPAPVSVPQVQGTLTMPSATTDTPEATDTAQVTDNLFVILVKRKAPKLRPADDNSVVDMGKGICNDYNRDRDHDGRDRTREHARGGLHPFDLDRRLLPRAQRRVANRRRRGGELGHGAEPAAVRAR